MVFSLFDIQVTGKHKKKSNRFISLLYSLIYLQVGHRAIFNFQVFLEFKFVHFAIFKQRNLLNLLAFRFENICWNSIHLTLSS